MIEKVVMKNWKSYREEEFRFEKGANALIGDMGSGKSSVLEAVVFGLYGDLPARRERRISLDDLITRNPNPEQEAEVEVVFSRNGKTYSVKRWLERESGTTKSILKEEGEVIAGPKTTEVTEAVENVIGLDFDTFTSIIYSEQNSMDFFLDLRPSERKERIDGLLRIDRFEDARSSIVTLKNRVKDILKSRENDLESLEEDFDISSIEDVGESIEKLEESIETYEDRIEGKQEKLEDIEEDLEKLKKERKKVEKLREQKTKLKTRVKSIEERIENKDVIEGLNSREEVSEKIDNEEKRKEELEELKESIKDGKKDLKFLGEQIKETEEDIEELEKKGKKLEELDGIKESIQERKEELEDLRKKSSEHKAEIGNLKESLKKLSRSTGKCPTCGKPLDDEHRIEKLKEFRKEKESREEKLEKTDNNIRTARKELEKLEEKKNKLLKLGDVDKKKEKKEEKLESLDDKKEEKEKHIDELKEDYSEEELEKVENRLERLETTYEVIELKEKLEKIRKKLENTVDKLEDSDFDEERFEEIRDEYSSVKSDIKVLSNKKKSDREILSERKKRLEELKKRKKSIEKLRSEIEKWKTLEDFLGRFRESLKDTQQMIREKFVKKLNRVMERYWDSIYPYEDYTGIRIEVENDYVLRLRDGRDRWVSVDGEVSGGERHSAAITLRLALSSVLGHEFQVLMLDEPTHNLDNRTVRDLAETLREDVSGLVDQVILITHDTGLEDAVNSFLYHLEKDESTGITESREVYSP